MPIRDTAVMDAFLDLTLESQTWELALFDGDPMLDGAELDSTTAPGYARATIAPTDWAAATDGEKTLTAPANCGTPADAWVESTHWLLFRASDGAGGPTSALTGTLEVADAGGVVEVLPNVFFDDAVEALV